MPQALLEAVTHYAEQQKESRAAFIRHALEHYLAELREREMEEAYVQGYQRIPEDVSVGETGAKLAAMVFSEEKWQMRWGEVWWADLPEPRGRRPVLLLTRDQAIPMYDDVTVAEITRTVWGIPVEVHLDEGDGMPTACVVNLDVINTVPKALLTERIAALSDERMAQVEAAIHFALGLRDR